MSDSTCTGCGAKIRWITSEHGKPMPIDATETTIATDDGKLVRGHVPHHITCPKAADFKGGKKEAPEPTKYTVQDNENVADKCKVCGRPTTYTVWSPEDSDKTYELWHCPNREEGHGRWVKLKGSNDIPYWKHGKKRKG